MWKDKPQAIDFATRRKTLLKKLKGAIALFPSATQQLRNNDVTHPYRQDSHFYYLSGFNEANSTLLFVPQSKSPFQMFVQPRDKTKELWEGKIHGPEAAEDLFGADLALPSTPETHFEDAFTTALAEAEALYYRVGVQPEWDQRVFGLMRKAMRKLGRTGRPLWPIHDPEDLLGEMRLVKSKPEIERLERAGQITAEAHVSAMRFAKPGMYEYEVEAVLFHAFRVNGASRLGYESIVASGPNACVLHYVANDRRMTERDLLLVDAGAEYDYYTADITRVFPVGGRFSEAQRDVYEAVLKAQKECIRQARPGKTMRMIHEHAVEVLVEELKRLKALKGPSKRIIDKLEYKEFYPHGTGHWLGMDVHDVGRYYNGHYDSARKLEPGMVFTVEPGLYFAPDSSAPARLKGIGVRIEDDVVITPDGCRVLTSGVPKEVDEVESLAGQT